MHTERIKELSNYLLDGRPSLDELLRHLFLETLNYRDPQAIVYSQLGVKSEVHLVASFGNIVDRIHDEAPIPLTCRNPFCDAIRTQTLHSGELTGVTPNSGIDINNLHLQSGPSKIVWSHFISVPVGRRGSLALFFERKGEERVAEEQFFIYLGILIAIYLNGNSQPDSHGKNSHSQPRLATGGLNNLTLRQLRILKLVRTGLTNLEISRSIGYSESLVRQELVRIFRILGTNSRLELREFNFPGLDDEAQQLHASSH